ncbi:SMI1/KNR4 family protein [Paucibacter sp. R3-3]|uniref:SMI1/KNR4 family protein n=1 Tax=Roseateles agri TaxID=3098619 RepID=A0ABU5DAX7_9BURK|nr:SMI1/KNR4 family protein [Paucibacter sp. R3-3]MDY0743289.1 SMI1/KNR4 family protein [Paucibacter sp. R3-3]
MKITPNLIAEIVQAELQMQTYLEDEPRAPVAAAPAPVNDIARLRASLEQSGLHLPPSYAAFLAVCDGMEGYRSGFSLLCVAKVLRPPAATFVRRYPGYARFIIGLGESLEFLAFDPDKAHGDEYDVVFVADDGEETRYDDFEAYLTERLEQVRAAIDRERADRDKPKKARK